MAERSHPLVELLKQDRRYTLDAYQFVRDALTYAQEVLSMGGGDSSARGPEGEADERAADFAIGEPFAEDGLADDDAPDDDAEDSGAEDSGAEDSDAEDESPHFQPLDEEGVERAAAGEKHVTGQQLCEAIRQYAVDQYGYMARPVLGSWGINETGDFGEIVYNLIGIGLMKKSAGDRREDFNDVYDFEEAFLHAFEITIPD
jgi:uncharacterized repeat protein (TIGR04138 family)